MANAKNCYLDGVRFAINPLFLIDKDDDENEEKQSDSHFSSKSLKRKVDRMRDSPALNYDTNRALSLLNCKQQNLVTKSKMKNTKKSTLSNLDNEPSTKTNNDTNNNQITETHLNMRLNSSSYCLKETRTKKEIPTSNDETKTQLLSSSFPNTFNNMHILSNNTNSQPNSTIFKVNFSSTLLEPIKQTQNATSTNTTNSSVINTVTTTSNNNGLKLNYKDIINFDTTSSSLDPFNDVELKTINDLEELKNILENHKFESLAVNNENHANSTGIGGANSSLYKNLNSFSSSNNNSIDCSTAMPSKENSNLSKQTASTSSTTAHSFQLDNFGLPKISFVDLDNK